MKCPDCCKGKIFGIGCGDEGCKPMTIPCPRCVGTAEVPEEMRGWMKAGEKIRAARLKSKLGLRAFSKVYGIDPGVRSRRELGIIDPDTTEDIPYEWSEVEDGK